MGHDRAIKEKLAAEKARGVGLGRPEKICRLDAEKN